jgi:uncharacterized protein YkwD
MKKVLLYFMLAAVLSAVFFFWNDILGVYEKFSTKLPGLEEQINTVIEETAGKIVIPQPLIFSGGSEESSLTAKGVIEWTNKQRADYGLAPLEENLNLDASAAMKTENMFQDQYFAHDSLTGEGVGDLAGISGYYFLVIGENLAMGNFENDEALIQAWMDSEGHRENILNPDYKDIGVSVKKGVYQGRTIWMAVQHFGRPLSDCESPSSLLKQKISSNEEQISEMQTELETLKSELEEIRPSDRNFYSEKVQEYNKTVDAYNAILAETKILISKYNEDVNSFNACAAGTQ